jgi:hypothetical protein
MTQKVKTVKEWLDTSGHQFEVIQYYDEPPDQIKMARRLSDGIPFLRFAPWDYGMNKKSYDSFYVLDFLSDMKTIKYRMMIDGDTREGECEINDVILDEDNKGTVLFIGKKVKSWKSN